MEFEIIKPGYFQSDKFDVHISGERTYVVFPDDEEIIVATKNLQFHSAS